MAVDAYMKLPYTIETTKEDDGSYFIKVKELPGCMSYGETLDEAYAMIADAMKSWLTVQIEDGQEIPVP